MKKIYRQCSGMILLLLGMAALLSWSLCMAADSRQSAPSIGNIAGNVFNVAVGVRQIIQAICIITGSSFIIGSLYQYKKYRNNPIEMRLGTVLFTFIIGVAVILLSFIPIPSD